MGHKRKCRGHHHRKRRRSRNYHHHCHWGCGCECDHHHERHPGHHSEAFTCHPIVCLPPHPPICDQHLRVNLAGLTGNLPFQFFRAKGCRVKIKYECSGGTSEVEGIICNVGNDNVSLQRPDLTVLTILIERICEVEWPDPECNPCVPCQRL